MLRPLPLVAVRQQERQPGFFAPLVLGRRDELVDENLRAVGEVAVLRLPEHERVGIVDAVSVLEPEHTCLREGAVVDLEGRLLGSELAERRHCLSRLRVVEDHVPLRKGASGRVLPRHPNRRFLEQDRSERERLRGRPVERQRTLGHLGPARELLHHLRIQVEAGGDGRQSAADSQERLARHACRDDLD